MEKLKKPQKQDIYLLEDLDISTRLYQFLKNSIRIKSLDDLIQKTETEVSVLFGVEHKSYLNELKKILSYKNLSFKKEEVWKGTEFWTEEITKAGLKDKLRFFNDVVIEKRPPVSEANFGDPALADVVLDGKKCDIYHTDKTSRDAWHRLFIHIKE